MITNLVRGSRMTVAGCCKKIWDAGKVFDQMPERTIVSLKLVMISYVESLMIIILDCGAEGGPLSKIVFINGG